MFQDLTVSLSLSIKSSLGNCVVMNIENALAGKIGIVNEATVTK